MKRIVMIPLDDRPCNYKYPLLLPKEDYEIILPGKDIMCFHKQEADFNSLSKFLLDNVKGADDLVLSLDCLIFGGLVPSRLHHYSFSTLIKRLEIIKRIKEINKDIKIYGFELIMRCPSYSSDAEEPTYYKTCGKEIFRLGELTHLESLNKLTEAEIKEMKELKSFIKEEYINDYLERRNTNRSVLMETLKLVKDGYFDYFIVPQDDASVYGYTAMDQIKVREYIKSNLLHTTVSMYPSADDVGLSLIGKAISDLNNYKPKVFVKYSSPKAPFCIPWFEDRMQDETIKYQILSIGGIRVYSVEEADIVLAINMTSKMLHKDDPEYVAVYDIERNLAEFINYIKYAKSLGKIVAIGDTAFCNGSDPEFVRLLAKNNLLLDVDIYAGWNTSSNTIGTTLAAATAYYFGKDEKSKNRFLIYRYYEDYGYMVYARKWISENILPIYHLDPFDLENKNDIISKYVKDEINKVMKNDLGELTKYVDEIKVKMPWNRMFECDLDIIFKK